MDYRELLKKYMSHVGDYEGIDYLSDYYIRPNYDGVFSKEEVEELRQISKETM